MSETNDPKKVIPRSIRIWVGLTHGQAWIPIAGIVVWLALLAGLLNWHPWHHSHHAKPAATQTVSVDRLLTDIKADQVKSAGLSGHSASATLVNGVTYHAQVPNSRFADVYSALAAKNIPREIQAAPVKSPGLLSSWLFWALVSVLGTVLLIVGLRAYQRKRYSDARAYYGLDKKNEEDAVIEAERPTTRFSSIAGYADVKDQVGDIRDFLKDPVRFRAKGAKIPKGILLTGEPGNGKTLFARALAGEAGVPFFAVSGAEFANLYVGSGARRVRKLFAAARAASPCIVFIDEVDSLASKREGGSNNSEREATLTQVLAEIDGFVKDEECNVVVLCATNRPDVLDSAFVRPGRIDRQVVVRNPTKTERIAILQIHMSNKPQDGVDYEVTAGHTPGASGADLENICNEAAIRIVKEDRPVITQKDMDWAIQQVYLGTAHTEKSITFDKWVTCVHEAGHALICYLSSLPNPDLVNVMPRGRTGGVTFTPRGDTGYMTNRELYQRIVMSWGGRAAEEWVFAGAEGFSDGDYGKNVFSSGASGDLQAITNMLKSMVTEYAMSPDVFLAYDEGGKLFGADSDRIIEKMNKIGSDGLEDSRKIINKYQRYLVALAQELFEKEVMGADALESFWKQLKDEEIALPSMAQCDEFRDMVLSHEPLFVQTLAA